VRPNGAVPYNIPDAALNGTASMLNCSLLQKALAMLQALAVPAIAAVGVWIAARQMVIADEKLKIDAFDRQYNRRVAVYEATREFLRSAYDKQNLSEAQIRAYALRTLDAQFLFDDGLYRYLRELLRRVSTFNDANISIENLANGERKNAYLRLRDENENWIRQQGDERTGFAVRFEPFLVLNLPKRPWWARWP